MTPFHSILTKVESNTGDFINVQCAEVRYLMYLTIACIKIGKSHIKFAENIKGFTWVQIIYPMSHVTFYFFTYVAMSLFIRPWRHCLQFL